MSDHEDEPPVGSNPLDVPPERPAGSGGGMRSCIFLVAIILAIPLYLLSLPMILSIGSGDSHSRGLTVAFAMLFQLVMWPLLALFSLLRLLPAKPSTGIGWLWLFLAAGGAAGSTVAIGMMSRPDWLALSPIVLPLLVFFFAFWAPKQSGELRVRRDPVAIGLAVIALALIVGPFAAYAKWEIDRPAREAEWARLQAEEERRVAAAAAAEEARWQALGPDSRLDDALPFLDYPRTEQALARIRTLNSRQTDAVRLVGAATDLAPFIQLHEFALDPADPALCRTYGGRIDARLQEAMRPGANQEWMATELEAQLPNMRWFIAGGCDLSGPLRNLGAALRLQPEYVDTNAFQGELANLQSQP